MQEIPVYLFNGFLESGKTSFIADILSDPNFTEDERSLVILCEEGIEELDDSLLSRARATVVTVEDKSELSLRWFRDLAKQHKPDRVLIEFNGMWELDPFIENCLPPEWPLYQIVATVNAETFELYAANMGPRMFEHLTTADLIVFNRCTDELKDMLHKRNIRAMNPRATIFLDDVNGGSEDYRDNMELPFDLDAPVIDIKDEDFGLWYVDASGAPDKYEGKVVRFKGMAYKSPQVAKNEFVPGRFAMVCCAEDITFVGFICRGADTRKIEDKGWYWVTAEMRTEYNPAYRGEGPVLYYRHIEPAEKPIEEVATFS